MKIKNNKGPKWEPRGTPEDTENLCEEYKLL